MRRFFVGLLVFCSSPLFVLVALAAAALLGFFLGCAVMA